MRWLIALLALLPAPALADLTAVYADPGHKSAMTIEIAANGDVHGDMIGRPGTTFVRHQGEFYFIESSPSGPMVMRVDDMAQVMAEEIAKLPADQRPFATPPRVPVLVRKGSATVGGRTGTAWYMQQSDGQLAERPWVVISDDPALAPLGQAMASEFDLSKRLLLPAMGEAPFQPMQDVLKTGTPITFTQVELKSVSNDPIPASHFALPGRPASIEQVRKVMTAAPAKD